MGLGTKIVFGAQFPRLAPSRGIALGGRGTVWVTPPMLIALNFLPCPALPWRVSRALPLWGEYPGRGERKQRLWEGTNEAEIKNDKEKEEEREAKAQIQILSGAVGRSQCVTQPLLCRC